jgi:hypothetical protein
MTQISPISIRTVIASVALVMVAGALSSACAAGRFRAERFTLKSPEEIEGVPCGAGYIWRFPDGRLHRCTLDHDAIVRNAPLPKGAAVAFNEDGSHAYVFLPKTTTIEGYACKGSGHNFMTTFHDNGRLKLCWMEENRDVQGIPCAGFSVWSDVLSGNPSGVYFHPDGRLAECRVTRDVKVGGRAYTQNERIYLDASGQPTGNPRAKPAK